MNKPVVAVVSSPNFLGLNIVENLLSKNCRVEIFTLDKLGWQEKTKHIVSANLKILNEKEILTGRPPDYAVLCQGFLGSGNMYGDFKKKYQPFFSKNIKTVAIFPFEPFDVKESSRLPLNGNLAAVYTGDLLGPRIDLDSQLLLPVSINQAIKKGEITLGVGEVFYPLFVSDAAREIVKWIFSFGPYGKEIFLMGNQTSSDTFWRQIQKVSTFDLKINYESGLPFRVLPRGYEIKNVPCNLPLILKETFAWALPRTPIPVPQKRIIPAIILFILLFPFLCLAVNTAFFYWSFKSFTKGNSDIARNVLLFSKVISFMGKEESRVLGYVPILGRPYRENFFALDFSLQLADIGVGVIHLTDLSKELFSKVFGDEVYDPEKIAGGIRLDLDDIYQKLSLFQGETENQKSQGIFLAKKLLSDFDFEKAKLLSFEGARIANDLPAILGKDKRKSYLVLFQNNMELRPTGGFIGSFGILTFEGGRMIDFGVSDVYSADGQLRGHIEPPEPIKKYLGEANWYLRDSNWDPDFPTSARRAEWFLDKEIDRKVDGVMSIDLYPISQILKSTGPIYLADYDMDITSENLYEKTQSEVQEEFFPGTHKKASFLTSLSRNLVTEIPNLPASAKINILKEFYRSLESRNIQIYLHDERTQNSVSNLGFSGEVLAPTCQGGCYSDFFGVVEANVGVNKANYFITRSETLRIRTTSEGIERELTLELKNSANPALGANGKYKSYIRILTREGTGAEAVSDVVGNEATNVPVEIYESKGRREIGFLTEVLGGGRKKLVISWSSKGDQDTNAGDYRLYVRKQAGTGPEDALSVVINEDLIYNSTLAKDVWIQKH